MHQASMFLGETTASQYATDTFDPVALSTHLRTENHHYYLCLQRRYSKDCPPLYLTKDGYEALRRDDGKLMDCFRLHTDTILNALLMCEPGELSVFVAMDHMVRFSAFAVVY
jgi:betaine lipid synthase